MGSMMNSERIRRRPNDSNSIRPTRSRDVIADSAASADLRKKDSLCVCVCVFLCVEELESETVGIRSDLVDRDGCSCGCSCCRGGGSHFGSSRMNLNLSVNTNELGFTAML